jgi:hypothetical protein
VPSTDAPSTQLDPLYEPTSPSLSDTAHLVAAHVRLVNGFVNTLAVVDQAPLESIRPAPELSMAAQNVLDVHDTDTKELVSLFVALLHVDPL